MRAAFAWLLAPAACVALEVLPGFGPGALRVVGAFVLFLILPGWLVHLHILPSARIHPAERIVRAFVLSLALGSVLGMAAWFLGGGAARGPVPGAGAPTPPILGRLGAVIWGEAAWLLIGALLLIVRRACGHGGAMGAGEQPAREGAVRSARRFAPSGGLLMLLVLVVLIGILGFRAGGIFGFESDAPDHLSCIREMVEGDRILPRTTFHIDGDGAAVDSRKGFYHVMAAAIARAAGVDPLVLWNLLPALLMPLALLVFYTFARRLLTSEVAVLCATALALICFGDASSGIFLRVNYGSQMGTLLAWAALAMALGAMRAGDGRGGPGPSIEWSAPERRVERGRLMVAGLAAFAAAGVHLFAAVHLLFAWGVFVAALLLLRGPRHPSFVRAAVIWAALFAGCVLPVVWRMAFTLATPNPLHTHRQGMLGLGGDFSLVASRLWWRYVGPFGLAAIALSPFLWRRARTDDAALYLAALSAAPVLVVANPLVVPLVEPVLGYLVDRLLYAIPFPIVLACIGYRLFAGLTERRTRRRSAAVLAFALLMVGLLIPRLAAFAHSHSPRAAAARHERSILAWKDLLDRMEDTIDPRSVVLSDP
ncbi:MAG: hypothetical protein V1774_10430, partial [Candidatus Eisenbacteria bacterium]